MGNTIDQNSKFNLSTAVVLLLDRNTHSMDVVSQILTGFGVHRIVRTQTVADANKALSGQNFDLIIIDPELEGEDGYDFVRDLRHSNSGNRFTPLLILSGHARVSRVSLGRDRGASFFVAKPITPAVLLERIYWVAGDRRKFVEGDGAAYAGPDRRFRFQGPPAGSDGRREGDLPAEMGAQVADNMSESELSGMFKPQKVVI